MGTLYCIQCGEAFKSDDPASVFCPEHGGKAQEDLFQTMPKQEPLPKTPKGTRIRRQEPMQHEPSGYHGKSFSTFAKGDILADLYQIDDIKAGGMGYVYIAKHQQWGVKLAIKSPNELMLSDPAFFSMILKEADAWTELGLHPNIAYCYYIRQFDGIPLIFIEYVDGGNLRDWIAEARCYDLKTGLDLAIQFCHGLEHAHKQGKIHRDIKPENILMTTNGTLKITDFGLIKGGGIAHGGRVGRGGTSFGTIMGTLAYMSPEQYEDASAIDERTDIYAFGVCLYEMFCGRLPYAQTSDQVAASYLARLDNRPAPEPTALRPDLPEVLAVILKRCIALDRAHRYPHLADLRQDLAAVYRQMYLEDAPHAELAQVDLRADALNNRAVSYLDLGREDDAITCWQEALTIDPQHFEATYNYNYLLFDRSRIAWHKFRSILEGLEGTSGNRTEYWKTVSRQYLAMGELKKVTEIQNTPHLITDIEFTGAFEKEKKLQIMTFTGHSKEVYCIALTADGRYTLSGDGSGCMKLWETMTGKEIRTLRGSTAKDTSQQNSIYSVAITLNGHYALSGDIAGLVRFWNLETGEERVFSPVHKSAVLCVAVTPDGRYGISGSYDMTMRIWDLAACKEIGVFGKHQDAVKCLAITPDGRYLLSGGYDNALILWDISRREKIRSFTGHTNWVYSVAITANGQYALSGSIDNTIKLWNLSTGAMVRTFHVDTSITSVAITPDDRYVVVGTHDQALKVWDLSSGKEIRSFTSHDGEIWPVVITPDGGHALSGSKDSTVKLWDIRALEKQPCRPAYPLLSEITEILSLMLQSKKIREMVNEARLAITGGDYKAALTRLRHAQTHPGFERDDEIQDVLHSCREGKKHHVRGLVNGWCKRTFQGHRSGIGAISVTPDGRYLLSSSQDETFKVWEVSTGKPVNTFMGCSTDDMLSSLPITPDGRYVFSCLYNDLILWELATGSEVRDFMIESEIDINSEIVTAVAITPNGQYGLSGHGDNTLKLWNLATGQEIRHFTGHSDIISFIAITQDSRLVLSASKDTTVKLWELATGRHIRTFTGHSDWVTSVATTQDGRYAVSGSFDSTLKLWNLAADQEICTYYGHTDKVSSVVVTPNGRFILSGGKDTSLRLWDLSTGKEIQIFRGHSDMITSMVITQNGRYAVSGSRDYSLKLWEFDWDFELLE